MSTERALSYCWVLAVFSYLLHLVPLSPGWASMLLSAEGFRLPPSHRIRSLFSVTKGEPSLWYAVAGCIICKVLLQGARSLLESHRSLRCSLCTPSSLFAQNRALACGLTLACSVVADHSAPLNEVLTLP